MFYQDYHIKFAIFVHTAFIIEIILNMWKFTYFIGKGDLKIQCIMFIMHNVTITNGYLLTYFDVMHKLILLRIVQWLVTQYKNKEVMFFLYSLFSLLSNDLK